MAHNANYTEIAACLASVEVMIERARLLSEEYDRRIRKADNNGPPIESLKHVISFPEVRSLDLLCKDALERALPDHPKYAEDWFVNENVGGSGPEDLHSELVFKKQILLHALHVIQARESGGAETSETSEYNLPKEYQKIADPVRLFFEDQELNCQDYDKNVFIMTRFQRGNKALETLDSSVRNPLRTRGLIAHRADDRVYPNDRNLWDNVCTYMFCCKFGVAVLENIIADEFNPNVALEYGFMRALGKPTLLLKEKRFNPRADILGTVWAEFDILDIEKTVEDAIDHWLRDLGI